MSPDIGGSRLGLGKPLQPDYRELETTAQMEYTKAGLSIVPNTLDVPFEELGGNLWDYKAPSSKPEMPLNVLTGISYPDAAISSKAELKQYNRLKEELPVKLGMELTRQNRKPMEERDSEFVIFERILKFTARALAWLEDISEIDPEAYVENNSKNTLLPILALSGWITTAEQLVEEMTYLSSIANLEGSMPSLKENIEMIMPCILEGKEVLKADHLTQTRALQSLKVRAFALQKSFTQQRLSNALSISESLIEALLPVVMVLSKEHASPAFFHLYLGVEGLKVTDDEKMGKSMQSILQTVSQVNGDIPESEQRLTASLLHVLTLALLLL